MSDREKRRLATEWPCEVDNRGLKSSWTTPLSGEAQIKSITGG